MNAFPTPAGDLVNRSIAALKAKTTEKPATALILGSGLGQFAESLVNSVSIPTDTIPGYPRSTVPGHAGWIHLGQLRSARRISSPVLVFQGRIHPYESGSFEESSVNVRMAASIGVTRLIITNAAGGIRTGLDPGSLMCHSGLMMLPIRSRYNTANSQMTLPTALHTSSYDEHLTKTIHVAARSLGLTLQSGTYCFVPGPSYETPAEIQMLRVIGADAVGMSTYPEVVAARDSSLPVAAISLISNLASGLADDPLTHEDVTRVARDAGSNLSRLLVETILQLDAQQNA